MKTKNNSGFTLMELMVSVAVLAILTAIGVPVLSDIVDKRKVSAQTSGISSAFGIARSEALSQLRDVSICWNSTGADISPTGDAGELTIEPRHMAVYIPAVAEVTDAAGNVEVPEVPFQVIRNFEYADSQVVVVDDDADDCIAFNSDGRGIDPAGATLLIGVCKAADDSSDSQVVTLTLAGRALVQSNDSGVDEDGDSVSDLRIECN